VIAVVAYMGSMRMSEPRAKHVVLEPSRIGQTDEPSVTTERPDWVDKPSSLAHEGIYVLPIKSGLYATESECRRALDDAMAVALRDYVDTLVGQPGAGDQLGIGPGYLNRSALIKQPFFLETIESPSVGKMQQLHARLEFDKTTQVMFQDVWHRYLATKNVRWAVAGFAVILVILGLVHLSLRRDPAKQGRFGRRLLSTSALAILLGTAGACFLVVA
jgi:hypothetical protein